MKTFDSLLNFQQHIMYNLKNLGGTFKGTIGECMFKLTRRNLFLTRFHPKNYVMLYTGNFLNNVQISFLKENYYSVDAIEVINRNVVLFEIKTRNRYSSPVKYAPKITRATVDLYKKAILFGFNVKTAYIWLENDWEYSVEIKDFDELDFYVDRKKRYDHRGVKGENIAPGRFELPSQPPKG